MQHGFNEANVGVSGAADQHIFAGLAAREIPGAWPTLFGSELNWHGRVWSSNAKVAGSCKYVVSCVLASVCFAALRC